MRPVEPVDDPFSTPNSRKSLLRRVYSVTPVAMARVTRDSSRLSRLLRLLNGRRSSERHDAEPMTPVAAAV